MASPNGTNFFKIEGRNAGGAGKSVKRIQKFTIIGQKAQDTVMDGGPSR